MVIYLILDLFLNTIKDKGTARARDTATSVNMTVDIKQNGRVFD